MKMVLIGSGGHAGVVIDAIRKLGEFEVVRLIDETCEEQFRHGIQVDRDGADKWDQLFQFVAIGNNALRERFSRREVNFISVIHPSAQIHSAACYGTYFGANCVVGNGSKVGDFSIINTGVILEHDSTVGNFSHLAPGVLTGGRVKIGHRTTIGLGAVIQDGVTIGDNCIVGMGSVVVKDIPSGQVWWGSPAKYQRENK